MVMMILMTMRAMTKLSVMMTTTRVMTVTMVLMTCDHENDDEAVSNNDNNEGDDGDNGVDDMCRHQGRRDLQGSGGGNDSERNGSLQQVALCGHPP